MVKTIWLSLDNSSAWLDRNIFLLHGDFYLFFLFPVCWRGQISAWQTFKTTENASLCLTFVGPKRTHLVAPVFGSVGAPTVPFLALPLSSQKN